MPAPPFPSHCHQHIQLLILMHRMHDLRAFLTLSDIERPPVVAGMVRLHQVHRQWQPGKVIVRHCMRAHAHIVLNVHQDWPAGDGQFSGVSVVIHIACQLFSRRRNLALLCP